MPPSFAAPIGMPPDAETVSCNSTEELVPLFGRDPIPTLPKGFVRDAATFEPLERLTVRRADGGADLLNELEWDGRHLWANRWKSDEIVRIDLTCGTVDAVVDTSGLTARVAAMPVPDGLPGPDVVNGVASIPGSDRYLVTGKRWPTMFEVRFVPA